MPNLRIGVEAMDFQADHGENTSIQNKTRQNKVKMKRMIHEGFHSEQEILRVQTEYICDSNQAQRETWN